MSLPTYRILAENIDLSRRDALAKELGISTLLATLLVERGIDTEDKGRMFLNPSYQNLHDPMLLTDMSKAVDRVMQAVSSNECVCIFGDYDVDGVTSVAVLYRYLYDCGVNVQYYIPSREAEGYGMNAEAIKRLASLGVSLIITVDTGTTAIAEVALAKQLHMDVVVTDHHACPETLPDAVAVVNPTRSDNAYPFSSLAGVGVSFKLVCALEAARSGERDFSLCADRLLNVYGDLVCLGTVADVMPLVDENRYIVKKGLEIASRTRNKGLAALIDVALAGKENRSFKSRNLTARMIAFSLAPKINAAGRMANADIAERLFLSESDSEAIEIAERLCELNKERQACENEIVSLAVRQMTEADLNDAPVLVLGDEGWHPGVIGIAAARITERYGRPSILIGFEGNEGKGSMRSVDGFDAMDALRYASDLLTKFGGHTLAAGMSLAREDFYEFRRRMCEYASLHLPTDSAIRGPAAVADAELSVTDITLPNAKAIAGLAPFGGGNELPVFLLSDIEIESMLPLSGGKHTRLTLCKDDIRVSAVLFGAGPQVCHVQVGDRVDVFGHLEVNEYGRSTYVQFMVKNIFLSATADEQFENETTYYRNVMQGECQMDDFPTRSEFAAVYRFLSAAFQNGTTELGFRHASACCARLGYCKLRVILDIFKQTKLIEYHAEGKQDRFRFAVTPTKEKVNIEQAPLYRRLQTDCYI